jgi:hypothetical protein
MPFHVEVGHFLNDQISPAQRALIPPTLKQAYAAADKVASENPILDVQSARDQHGRVRSWAVDLAFEKLIDTGQWPFDYAWAWFDKPTGRYLRIRTEAATLTISLIDEPSKPPRHVKFRQNNAFDNEPSLFPEMDEERKIGGMPGFLLVHGHKTLDFANVGMAHPKKRRWLYRTGNLMLTPHEFIDDLPPVEAEDEEAILTLKQEIQKWSRDNGNV